MEETLQRKARAIIRDIVTAFLFSLFDFFSLFLKMVWCYPLGAGNVAACSLRGSHCVISATQDPRERLHIWGLFLLLFHTSLSSVTWLVMSCLRGCRYVEDIQYFLEDFNVLERKKMNLRAPKGSIFILSWLNSKSIAKCLTCSSFKIAVAE